MIRNTIIATLSVIAFLSFQSCQDKDVLPKPQSQLALEYPVARYVAYEDNCPYGFFANKDAVLKQKEGCNFTIQYPKMKATLFLSYYPVNNNIKDLLKDAQKLTYDHVIKADNIVEQPYFNPEKRVYGMFYSVGGNAATNSQFYATDSTKHFVRGSLYFYAKPNFDSIMPAAAYIKNDMQTLMETLHWK